MEARGQKNILAQVCEKTVMRVDVCETKTGEVVVVCVAKITEGGSGQVDRCLSGWDQKSWW